MPLLWTRVTLVTSYVRFHIYGRGCPRCRVSSSEKADILAARLREYFYAEDVRVSRPTKAAELRIGGLDDATTTAQVVAAIARLGGCSPEDVATQDLVVLSLPFRCSYWTYQGSDLCYRCAATAGSIAVLQKPQRAMVLRVGTVRSPMSRSAYWRNPRLGTWRQKFSRHCTGLVRRPGRGASVAAPRGPGGELAGQVFTPYPPSRRSDRY